MKRSPRFRKEHKAISAYHTSKHWQHPNQCPARYREPLDEISVGYRHWRGYVSPMIDENNSKYWDDWFNNKPLYMQVFSRYDRNVDVYQKYDSRTYYKANADHRDSKNGIELDYVNQAFDYLDRVGEFEQEYGDDCDCWGVDCDCWGYDDEYYEYNIMPFLEDMNRLKSENIAWEDYKNSNLQYPQNDERYKRIRKNAECNYSYNITDKYSQMDEDDKLTFCPDGGRFVENAA